MQVPAIQLVVNYPLPGAHADALVQSLATHLRAHANDALRYLPVEGTDALAAAAAQALSFHAHAIDAQRVVFGVSGHQLLLASLLGLTRAGDAIACDPVTYNGWLNIVRLTERRHVVVTGDCEGMLPEELDAAARKSPLWGVFLMPSMHNPRTSCMSLARRTALVEVCRRHKLWIIDDDAYRFLAEEQLPSFAHLMPERSVWIQSLTKPMFPSIKTALAAVPADAAACMREAQRASGHQPSALTLPWVLEQLRSGAVAALVAEKRAEARARQALAQEALAGFHVETQPTSFHLWLHLPEHLTEDAAMAALDGAGVSVVRGSAYAPERPPHAIRIALAGEPDRARALEGVRRVGEALRTEARSSRPGL